MDVPAAAYLRNTGVSVASSSWTTFPLTTEDVDGPGFHDPVTNTSRATIPPGYDGYYVVIAYSLSQATHTGFRGVRIRKNGTTVTSTFEYAGSDTYGIVAAPVWDVLYLQYGDYVEMQGWQDSGSSRNYDCALLIAKIRVEDVCYATFSGSQSISSGSFTDGPSLTEAVDPTGMHDAGTNPDRVTIQTDGRYLILAAGGWTPASDGTSRGIRLQKNATELAGSPAYIIPSNSVNEIGTQTYAIADLTAGDYITVAHRQLSGSSKTLSGTRLCVLNIGASECGYGTGTGTTAVGAASTTGPLDLTVEQVDPSGWHSNVTNPSRFTCQKTGTYLLLGKTQLDGPQLIANADMLVNGSTIGDQGQLPGNAAYAVSPIQARVISLTSGDYVQIQAYSGDAADTCSLSATTVGFVNVEDLAAPVVTFVPQIIRHN